MSCGACAKSVAKHIIVKILGGDGSYGITEAILRPGIYDEIQRSIYAILKGTIIPKLIEPVIPEGNPTVLDFGRLLVPPGKDTGENAARHGQGVPGYQNEGGHCEQDIELAVEKRKMAPSSKQTCLPCEISYYKKGMCQESMLVRPLEIESGMMKLPGAPGNGAEANWDIVVKHSPRQVQIIF